jgi:cytochrome c biogenesis protein CcmG/thiol:disulfide interchange protein DsbE
VTESTGPAARGGIGRFVPLILFLALAALFAGYLLATQFFGYQRDTLPSALIGRPAPATELPALEGREGPDFTAALLSAPGVKVVNVWASWCGPCRIEHPALMELERRGVTVHGINYRDEPRAARGFLAELGDPFVSVGADRTGRSGVEWGVYGVPETFVVDGEGRIAFKHVGPIQNDDLEARLIPAIRAAGGTVAD